MSDTTHEAPERIWACVSKNTKSGVVTLLGDATFPVDGWREYVRADLMEAAEQQGYASAMEAERKLHEARIEELTGERDHWKDVAGREGVCMTCRGPYGAPEHYGCFDCFNTGYCGEHHNTVADLEAKLAKAVEVLSFASNVDTADWSEALDVRNQARATLAEIKG